MENQEKRVEGARKRKAPKGTRTQKMFNFRLDDSLSNWLDTQPNKGRYLNDLIRNDMQKHIPDRD